MLNADDRRMLRILQTEPEASLSVLADKIGISGSALTRRLVDLRQKNIIKRTRATVDWKALGYEIEVSLRIRFDKSSPRALDEIIAAARQIDEVIEIQTFIGQVELRLGVIAFDLAHYQQLYRSKILTLPHLVDIEALMHIGRIKNERLLPL